MPVPDFIRRAIEAQGKTTVAEVERALAEGDVVPPDEDDPSSLTPPRHWQEEAEDRGRDA